MINFANDIVAFYLIRVHWNLITQHWIKAPLQHGSAWLTVFYLTFLLVRYRKGAAPAPAKALPAPVDGTGRGVNAPLDIQLAHALERRIRVVIPALKGDQERFYLLEILLRKRPAIREIRSEMPDRLTDHPFRPGGHHARRPARRRDADRHRAGASRPRKAQTGSSKPSAKDRCCAVRWPSRE